MIRSYRLAVADCAAARKALTKALATTGHQITIQAGSVEELVEEYRVANPSPDIILVDVLLIDECSLDAATALQATDTPIVVSAQPRTSKDKLQIAHAFRPFGFLIKPVHEIDLCTAIDVAIERFIELQLAKGESARLQQDLEDRKLVERAKGFIMKRQGVDEMHAYQCLHKFARDRGQKLVDVAKAIVLVEADLLCVGRT